MALMSEAALAKLFLHILLQAGGVQKYPQQVVITSTTHQEHLNSAFASSGEGYGNFVRDGGEPVSGFHFTYSRCKAFESSPGQMTYRGRLQYGTTLELLTPYDVHPCALAITKAPITYGSEFGPHVEGQTK
jgi:hypothetical protein